MSNPKSVTPGAPKEDSQERRRSIRLHLVMPVIVRGTVGTAPFEEQTKTAAVSAHGCLVRLRAQISKEHEVSLVNPKTAEELPCKVVSVGPSDDGKREVGLEFTEPSPLFWRIAFPPEDWDPAERKLPSFTPKRTPTSR